MSLRLLATVTETINVMDACRRLVEVEVPSSSGASSGVLDSCATPEDDLVVRRSEDGSPVLTRYRRQTGPPLLDNSIRRGDAPTTMEDVRTRRGRDARGLMAILLATGWSSAVAKQISDVFVTNDAAHPVPVQEQRTDASGNIKVHEQGTANVRVQGTVPVQGTIPDRAFSVSASCCALAGDFVSQDDPAGTNYAITTVGLDNTTDQPRQMDLFVVSPCSGPNVRIFDFGANLTAPAHDTVSMAFPQPLTLRGGNGTQCLEIGHAGTPSGNDLGHVTVVGYRF